MASEAQRQAALLNSGYLNTLGTSSGVIALDNVEQVIVHWMGKLVQEIVRRIDEPGENGKEISSSGHLSANTRFTYKKLGMAYVGYVHMPYYADYRDKGVQGLGPGNINTTSPYRFRFLNPSKNHINAIEDWVREKNNLTVITVPKGLTSIAKQQRSMAYLIAKYDKQHGIRPANFKKGAVAAIMDGFLRDISRAMAKDISIEFDYSNGF